jgi:polyhydroxyalkanoate synthase
VPVDAKGNDIDRKVRAALARAAGSLSMGLALLAAGDWGINLLVSPGKQMELALLALDYAGQAARYDLECFPAGTGEARRCVAPPVRDRRFEGDEWRRGRFEVLLRSFRLTEQLWAAAARARPLPRGGAPVDHGCAVA